MNSNKPHKEESLFDMKLILVSVDMYIYNLLPHTSVLYIQNICF